MAVKHTQDNFYTRAADTVHINPSILEGERGYPSIIGPKAAVPLDRIVPYNIQLPRVTGDYAIPSILTCEPGVWGGSPMPQFSYQWQANGVDIAGETKQTLSTTLDFDDNIMTCKVTGFSPVGSSVATSQGVTVFVTEPIINHENSQAVVTGLNQLGQQNLMRLDPTVVTGMWVDPRIDMMQKIELITTGMWVERRVDVESASVFPLVGLQIPQTTMVYQDDLYAVEPFSKVGDLTLINPDAQSATAMEGWTTRNDVENGHGTYKAMVVAAPINASEGNSSSLAFSVPMDVNQFSHSEAYQIADVPLDLHTQVDEGKIFYDMGVKVSQRYWNNWTVVVTSEFLAADGVTVLGSCSDTYTPYVYNWAFGRSPEKFPVPANTRKVKYILLLNKYPSANDQHIQADDLQAAFWING